MAKKPNILKLNMSKYESLLRQRAEIDIRERTCGNYDRLPDGSQVWVWDLKRLLGLAQKREKIEAGFRHLLEESLKV